MVESLKYLDNINYSKHRDSQYIGVLTPQPSCSPPGTTQDPG